MSQLNEPEIDQTPAREKFDAELKELDKIVANYVKEIPTDAIDAEDYRKDLDNLARAYRATVETECENRNKKFYHSHSSLKNVEVNVFYNRPTLKSYAIWKMEKLAQAKRLEDKIKHHVIITEQRREFFESLPVTLNKKQYREKMQELEMKVKPFPRKRTHVKVSKLGSERFQFSFE